MGQIPLWRQIETALTEDILAGRFDSGEKMPTEAALSERFGVNRHTVRRALSSMATAGLVRALRGSGVYVAPRPVELPFSVQMDLETRLAARGLRSERRVLWIEQRQATQSEAVLLSLDRDLTVTVCDSLFMADGEPICLCTHILPDQRAPDVAGQLHRGVSINGVLQDIAGHGARRHWDRVAARSATPQQARQLYLREGDAILFMIGILRDAQDRPVELSEYAYPADRLVFTFPDAGGDTGGAVHL